MDPSLVNRFAKRAVGNVELASPYGGVLCALPALAENVFRHLPTAFPTLTGYYATLHVVLLLAYMALCRIRTDFPVDLLDQSVVAGLGAPQPLAGEL